MADLDVFNTYFLFPAESEQFQLEIDANTN